MKPSDELFKLIKSLTKSEKRFFKLSSSLQSGEKNYLKLFDAIEKQREYDEEDIKGQFKKETFIHHLPSEKNHLYKLILKSLRAYHSDNSVNSILQEEIKNVEILYRKALYKECGKIIKKAKKLAYNHEKFYYTFELINWEKQLLEEEYLAGNFDRDLDKLIVEEQEVIEKLRNLAEYRILYSKINYVFRKGGIARDERELELVEEICDHRLIKGKNTALSRRAAATCYYIQGLAAVFRNDYKTSFTKFSRVVEIFEANPNLIQDIPKQYLRSLNNLLFCYIDNKDFEAFFDLMKKMRSLKNAPGFTSTDIQLKIFTSTYIAELIAYDALNAFEKGVNTIPEIEAKIEEFKGKLSKEEELLFFYNIAYTFYGAGMIKESLKYLNKILNDNESVLRQDIFSYSRLINLIVHYDLGNYDLLDYLVKSTTRYFQKRKKNQGFDFKFELTLLKSFRKLAKYHNDPEKKEQVFHDLKAELIDLLKEDFEQVTLGYFDFIAWINSHIFNISFAEARSQHSWESNPELLN